MTARPTSVLIGPYDIPIKTLDPASAAKDFGAFNGETLDIKLRENFASPQQAADTLLHEVLHAVWDISGCNIKDGEERLVTSLATGLCAVIKHNPALMGWLQESLRSASKESE